MKKFIAYAVTFPFMLVGGVAYVAKVGFKSGWAWAEYLGEKYL